MTIAHSKLPLLTIAVPTYNRSRYLARLLDSLMPQLAGEPRVELLVSDNASPDETPAMLEEYGRRGLLFRAIRNSINIGPDANFAQCFDEASGKYVWIVGDDDVILQGALSTVLGILCQGEYDMVHVRGKEVAYGTTPAPIRGKPKFEIIDNAKTFVLRTHVTLTFITANIINRQRVLSLPHRPFSDLNGTNLGQLGWTYTALRHFRKGAFLREPIIAVGGDDRGGYSLFNIFGTNLKRVTEEWLVDPALVRVVQNGTLQVFFPVWALHTKLGVSPFEGEKLDALLHALFSGNFRFYLFVYPVLKLPGTLARLWLFLCKVVNRLDRALGNPILR